MFALDLFNTKYERELREGAVDDLEARRIDDLNAKMQDLLARAKTANPEMKAALKREFDKVKTERDSYYKIKAECMGYGTLGENNVNEGQMKQMLWDMAERMERDQFIDYTTTEMGMDADESAEFWDSINGDLDEAGIPGNVPTEKIPGKEDLLKGKGRTYYEAGIPGSVPTEKIPGKEDLLKGKGRSYYEGQKKNSKEVTDPAVDRLLTRARREHPKARSNAEALAMHILNKEEKDVDRLDHVNDREDRMIAKLADLEQHLQHQIDQIRQPEELDESQQLHVGDPIIVVGPNEFEGKTGEVAEFSPSGKFVVVNLYNHGEHSMHLSDVEYNQYADTQDEEDDWYDDQEDTLEEANVNPQFINAQVTKILAGEARRMTNAPIAQLLAPVMKEYGLTLQQIDSMVPGGLKRAAGEYGIMMKEGWKGGVAGGAVGGYGGAVGGELAGQAAGSAIGGALGSAIGSAAPGPLSAMGAKAGETVGQHLGGGAGALIGKLAGAAAGATIGAKLGSKAGDKVSPDEKEVDEGWSNKMVAQRTGQAPTPYSVYIKGKEWKSFPDDDHAENVANKLRAKFKQEGRDPSVITIAPTDYDKDIKEAGNFNVDSLGDVECPNCHYNDLTWNDATQHAECRGCGAEYTEQGDEVSKDFSYLNNVKEAGNPAQQAAIAIAKKKEQGVAEVATDYSKRRQRERDVDAGKPVAKQRPSKMTDYQKKRAQDKKDMELGESHDDSGVEQAILHRIMVAHTDLLKQFGPQKVMQAAEEVAYNVGDVDEIGTSDVSAYVAQVRQILGA